MNLLLNFMDQLEVSAVNCQLSL